MKQIILALTAIVILGSTSACKKEKEQEKEPKTNLELLTQEEWNLTKTHHVTYQNDTVYYENISGGDGIKVKFDTDYTATFTSPNENPEVRGWTLTDSVLSFIDTDFTILTLTENEFIFQSEESDEEPGFENYRYVFTVYMNR